MNPLVGVYSTSDLKRILGVSKKTAERMLAAITPRFTLEEAWSLLRNPISAPETRLKATPLPNATLLALRGSQRKVTVPYILDSDLENHVLLAIIFTEAELHKARTNSPIYDPFIEFGSENPYPTILQFSKMVHLKLNRFLGDEYAPTAQMFSEHFLVACPERIVNPKFLSEEINESRAAQRELIQNQQKEKPTPPTESFSDESEPLWREYLEKMGIWQEKYGKDLR